MRTSKLCSGGKGISLRHGKQLLRCLPLVGMLFATSSVNAADSPGVKFNSGVRYSQWAINSRLHDFYGNQKKFGFDYYDQNGTRTSKVTWYKLDGKTTVTRSFDYVAGLVGKATLEAADYYENFDWSKSWFYAAQGYATETKYANTGLTLDNMNAAKMYLPILAGKLHSTDAETVANNAISEVINHMKTYNTTYSIGGSKSALNSTNANDVQKKMLGGWFHKSTDYTDQMWCDGQYMGPALLAQIINHNNSNKNISDNDWNIVAKQFNITWEQLYDRTTGLLYHGFTANPGDNASSAWAGISKENGIYHSASFWGRANAWYFLALVDVLEAMPTDNTNYNTLKGYLTTLATGIKNKQDEKTGCWYQVLDKTPASLTGNYLEASCSSIFTAAYLKAIRLGLLDKATYEPIAKKAYEGLVNQFMVYDNTDNNTIQLVKSCTSAGLGGSGKRAGNDNYYLTGDDAGVVTSATIGDTYYYTEGKVLGGFIMAATEYERAYQNQDQNSKQILFAKDLAPNYDFSTTAGSLDATAYGEGTPSYQWYKDDKAVDKATSATYAPTENGNYYCVATANGKTITTRTTTVTTKASTTGGDNNSGETTATSGKATFAIEKLKLLDSNPIENETSKLIVDGNITIEAGTKISWDSKKGGLKISKSDKSTFSIIANNNAKITKVVITQTASTSSKQLNYYPIADDNNGPENNVYTYDYSKKKPSKIAVSYNTGGNIYVTNIVVEYENEIVKTDLKASFSPATIDATVGASVTVPPLTVTAGEGNTPLASTDYTVSYTSSAENFVKVENGTTLVPVAKGNAVITATIKPTDETKYNETTATFTVTVNEKQEVVSGDVYKWNTVGTYTWQGDIKESDGAIRFASNYSNNAYMTIKPVSGGFKVGDVVTITGHCDSKNRSGIELHATADGNSIFKTPELATSAKGDATYIFTITEDCAALYLGRFGGGTTYVTALSVKRGAATSKTRLAASFAGGNSISVVKKAGVKNQTITLPALTVTADGKTIDAPAYKVDFKSNDVDVVKYNADNNNVSIVDKGIATITATVTPKEDAKYEGCTATYQITVTDPFSLKISTADITINITDADFKKPIISVFDKDDKQLSADNYTLSYRVVSGDVVSVKNGSLVVTGTPYNWKEGVATIEVTATPTEAFNRNGEYAVGTLTFTYEVNKGKRNPKFLENFSGITINIGKGHKRTITVPIVYDGEDVSEYFKYTYTSSNASVGEIAIDGSTLTFTAKSKGTTEITVAATPKTAATPDDKDYSEDWNEPANLTFTINVGNFGKTTVVVNPTEYNMTTGQIVELPDVIVTHNDVELDDNAYDVNWITSSPGVVRVTADGRLEAVSEGSKVSVRAVVTGTNLESTTALFTVNVDDPNVYRVKKGEEFEKYAVRTDQNHNVEVSLGGWMFQNPKDIADNIKKNESLGDGNWASTAIDGTTITGFSNYIGADKNDPIANARQEDGSNAQPMSTSLYDATLAGQGSIIDPMFNVPASGSYLVFAPKTNGTINAHVFQNGVFDATKEGKILQYRPQRRVMVVDEAGNVVSTEALIEAVTAKPSGFNKNTADLSNWTWDLKKGTTINAEMVKSHFKGDGINAFNFTVDGFANMVAESDLPYDIVKNEALKNEALKDKKGINGWCVLADAPVTYTFHVQAGKTYYLYNFGSRIGFYGFSFEEDNDIKVDPVVYEQAVDKTIEKTAAGHSATVSIDRVFKGGQWNAAVLPFSLNKQQVDEIFGQTYGNGNWDENATQILYFDRVEGNTIYFMRHAYNTIVAGKPFLIRPAKTGDILINTNELKNYKYVTIENDEPADWCWSNNGSYVWKSSYNPMTISKNDYYISAKDGKLYQRENKDLAAKGFRGFLHVNGGQKMTLRVAMGSKENDDNSTTVIEGIEMDSEGNIITTLENGKVYNVNGQVVADDSKSFSSLPSGVYIINGKKYIK